MKETPIVRHCLTCFSHHGFQILLPGWKTPYDIQTKKGVVWRNNTGGMKDKTGRHFVRFGINGAPDIIGFLTNGGRFFGYEVKKPGEKPTEMQVWYGDWVRSSGGLWGWGTSYEDCDRWLKEANL